MTPVEQVQEWLTAIGETTYDAEHRERLMWEELRELQAAMDEWHQYNTADATSGLTNWRLNWKLANVARELCDLAYVAIGTALLRSEDMSFFSLRTDRFVELDRAAIECGLYRSFFFVHESRHFQRAAAFYGFGPKLEACFAEVHAANMRKLDWGRTAVKMMDGKILKPANWQPPNLEPILFGEANQ